MINDTVFAFLFPGMVGPLVPPDPPGVTVEGVERVADIVVDVTDDVDQDHERLEGAVDEEVFDLSHRSGPVTVSGNKLNKGILPDPEFRVKLKPEQKDQCRNCFFFRWLECYVDVVVANSSVQFEILSST